MNANPRYQYWGRQEREEEDHEARGRFNTARWKQKSFTEEQQQEIKSMFLCGCSTEWFLQGTVAEKTKNLDDHIIARTMMQARINEYGGEDLPLPRTTDPGKAKPPDKPNAFPDGSVKNPKEVTWRIGGAGAWWPGRSLEEMQRSAVEA